MAMRRPMVEVLASSRDREDPRTSPTLPYIPKVSSVTIKEAAADPEDVDPFPALIKAIDRIFLAGWKYDLKATPLAALLLFEARNEKGELLVTDAHWSAYAREAGFLNSTPDAALRARVIEFYRSGRTNELLDDQEG